MFTKLYFKSDQMRFSRLSIAGESLFSTNNTYSKIIKPPLVRHTLSLGSYHGTQPQHELAADTSIACSQDLLFPVNSWIPGN